MNGLDDDDVGGDEPSLGSGGAPKRAGRGANARFRRTPVRQAAAERDDPHEPGVKRLKRQRKRTTERLYVDPQVIPEHMSYEWKAETCYGAQVDPTHIANIKENHWTPVPQERHPHIPVKQDGLVLMERPKYLTQEAKIEDYEIARDQARAVGLKLGETPDGQFTRDHPSARKNTSLTREYAPINVPTE